MVAIPEGFPADTRALWGGGCLRLLIMPGRFSLGLNMGLLTRCARTEPNEWRFSSLVLVRLTGRSKFIWVSDIR